MEGAKAPSILIIRDEGGNDNDYSDKMESGNHLHGDCRNIERYQSAEVK